MEIIFRCWVMMYAYLHHRELYEFMLKMIFKANYFNKLTIPLLNDILYCKDTNFFFSKKRRKNLVLISIIDLMECEIWKKKDFTIKIINVCLCFHANELMNHEYLHSVTFGKNCIPKFLRHRLFFYQQSGTECCNFT